MGQDEFEQYIFDLPPPEIKFKNELIIWNIGSYIIIQYMATKNNHNLEMNKVNTIVHSVDHLERLF